MAYDGKLLARARAQLDLIRSDNQADLGFGRRGQARIDACFGQRAAHAGGDAGQVVDGLEH